MPVTFREFNKEDLVFYIESSKVFYSLPFVDHPVPTTYFEKTFAYVLEENPYTKGFIIEHDQHSAGYLLTSLTYSNEVAGLVLLLEEIYIDENYRGQGIAKQLFSFVEETLVPKYDLKRVRLEVTENNTRALGLYEKMGYQELEYRQMIKDYIV